MLATLRSRPFSDKEWLYEWKFDGFRCFVRKSRERVDLLSRDGNRFNGSFPDIVDAVATVPGEFVWDAELAVGAARGKDSFSSLQQRARTTSLRNVPVAARRCPARLYVFDRCSRTEWTSVGGHSSSAKTACGTPSTTRRRWST
ncbi:hypothetical protein PTKU46_88200 [Paraburkholderia terrae]